MINLKKKWNIFIGNINLLFWYKIIDCLKNKYFDCLFIVFLDLFVYI